jgi:hypothetical protein
MRLASVGFLFAVQLGCSSQPNQAHRLDSAPDDGLPSGKGQIGPDSSEASTEIGHDMNIELTPLDPEVKAEVAPDLLRNPDLDVRNDALGSIGSIDGSWKLVGLSCNSSPDGAMMQRTLTLHGGSGTFSMTRGGCATNIAMTVAYPAAGTIVLTYGAVTCAPADCGCTTSEGRDSTGFPGAGPYVFEGGSLKITINNTSDSTCPSGRQTSTWTGPSPREIEVSLDGLSCMQSRCLLTPGGDLGPGLRQINSTSQSLPP